MQTGAEGFCDGLLPASAKFATERRRRRKKVLQIQQSGTRQPRCARGRQHEYDRNLRPKLCGLYLTHCSPRNRDRYETLSLDSRFRKFHSGKRFTLLLTYFVQPLSVRDGRLASAPAGCCRCEKFRALEAASFFDRINGIRWDVVEGLFGSAWPLDFDHIYPRMAA